MGKSPRSKPARLTEKLLQIRTSLGLSQNQIIRRLGLSEELYQASISGYELGTREPPLPAFIIGLERPHLAILFETHRSGGLTPDVQHQSRLRK